MTDSSGPVSHVEQYAEGAAHLILTRRTWRRGYRFALRDLRRLDERIEAHLDALVLCGESGEHALNELRAQDEPGALAALTMLRLARGDAALPNWLAMTCDDDGVLQADIDEAFAWVPYRYVSHCLGELFRSGNPHLRRIAVGAATEHRVPSLSLAACLQAAEPSLVGEVLRHIGTLRLNARTTILDPDLAQASGYWMAWAQLFTGSPTPALRALTALALESGAAQEDARDTALAVLPLGEAHELLRATTEADERSRVIGCALIGDSRYLPWLIERMAVPALARVAGEAFSTMTGIDLVHQGLDGPPLLDDLDEDEPLGLSATRSSDEELLWPDHKKVSAWWAAHQNLYPPGVRLLCGAPVCAASARRILQSGYQRHRALARVHLALLDPSAPVFGIDAPAWRQQAWLATT